MNESTIATSVLTALSYPRGSEAQIRCLEEIREQATAIIAAAGTPPESQPPPAEWAIVSLMGHCTFAGRVSEEEKFGIKMGRCDVPQADGSFITRYFSGSALYGFVHCTEAAARATAGAVIPAPVGMLSIPADHEIPEFDPDSDGSY